MKKISLLFLTVLLVFGFSPSAAAQGFDAGVKVGYSSTTGDLLEDYDGAFAIGFYGEYSFNPMFGLQLAYLYHNHELENDSSVEFKIHELVLNAKAAYPMEAFTPYAIGGFGIYFWDIDAANLDETDWGIDIGVGATYAVTDVIDIGAEVTYNHVFAEDTDQGVNDDAQFWNFLATLSYGFSMAGM